MYIFTIAKVHATNTMEGLGLQLDINSAEVFEQPGRTNCSFQLCDVHP